LSRGKTEDDILQEAREAASEARREAKAAAKARMSGSADGVNVQPSAGKITGERGNE